MPLLHYKTMGSGSPILILHGLFGMLDNWISVAKSLSSHFTVYLIDVRNHGKSFHSNVFDYAAMSNDVLEIMHHENLLSAIIMGHSMGGKIAMKFAQNYPEYVSKLIVVDIAPKYYPLHHDIILDALFAVGKQSVKSRSEAEEIMQRFIDEPDVVQFLLKSLYWQNEETLGWRFNVEVISKNIEEVGAETKDRIFNNPTLFITGEHSNYVKPQDLEEIKLLFPKATIQTIEKAGHWVHAENTPAFMKALNAFIGT